MPLSKEKQSEWMREHRKRVVIPKSPNVIPNELAGSLCVMSSREEIVIPKYMRTPIASVSMLQHLPNCPDGRYR